MTYEVTNLEKCATDLCTVNPDNYTYLAHWMSYTCGCLIQTHFVNVDIELRLNPASVLNA